LLNVKVWISSQKWEGNFRNDKKPHKSTKKN